MKLHVITQLLLLPLFLFLAPAHPGEISTTQPEDDCGKLVKYNQEVGSWTTVPQAVGDFEIFMQSHPRFVSLAIVSKDEFKLYGKDEIILQNDANQEQTFYVVETEAKETREGGKSYIHHVMITKAAVEWLSNSNLTNIYLKSHQKSNIDQHTVEASKGTSIAAMSKCVLSYL